MAYTHLGELEIKPTPIPLPIPNHGIYYHFGEIQTPSSPQLIYLWEVYLGVVAKVAFYMRIWRIQKGGSQREHGCVCWGVYTCGRKVGNLFVMGPLNLDVWGEGGGLPLNLFTYTRLIGCLVGPLRSHHILMLIQCNTTSGNKEREREREREFINYIVV